MKYKFWVGLSLVLICSIFSVVQAKEELIVYSGRSKSLVDPIIKQFEKENGIEVQVKYGNTAQLALTLMEEGEKSPADVFWAQDGGALGAISKNGDKGVPYLIDNSDTDAGKKILEIAKVINKNITNDKI